MHRVAVLALDGVYPFELGIPARILGAADGFYDVVTCSVDGRPVRTNADFEIAVTHDAQVLRNAGTVVIPPVEPIGLTRALPGPVREAIASIPRSARKISICTGAFILAAASLLDGRSATTHWECAPVFRQWFPEVNLTPEVLFVDEGDVVTSAGAAAGVDLCMHVVRSDCGTAVANEVARRCVVAPWRDGGQAQYVDRPVPARSAGATARTREWALARLDRSLRLPDLAAHAGMSLRGFVRHFQAEVGVSPGHWLIGERVSLAKQLLETTDLGIEHVARKAGFGTGASLRQHFQAQVAVSPSAYRRTFRAGRGVGPRLDRTEGATPLARADRQGS